MTPHASTTAHAPSLLWPPGADRAAARLPDSAAADLGLDHLSAAVAREVGYARSIREILHALSTDPAVIAYRQAVLAELLDNPDLAQRLAALLPEIGALDGFVYAARPGQSPLHEVAWRVSQLEAWVACVQGLHAALDAAPALRAEGLRLLRATVGGWARDPSFQRLAAELPALLDAMRRIASVTIGVNLDDQLRPVEATLLAVNRQKFRGPSASLLRSLFGANGEDSTWEGIAPLHSARPSSTLRPAERGLDLDNPLLQPLFRDLAQVLKQTARPVAAALQRYAHLNLRAFEGLGGELAFYLGAARLIERVRAAGLPFCRPEIAPTEARVCEVENSYNVNLALRLLAAGTADLGAAVVTNALHFGEEGRVFVLTGPNQGGKTTFTQAAGLLHVLAQAGLYVPGSRARISPADGIYTHFPVEERPEMEAGRLGEEARRLSEIFARATPHSLVLLNESLASTSPGESLYLARDVLRVLRQLGARAIYATHLHDLAVGCDELNRETPGASRVVSLVSVVHEGAGGVERTFHIEAGPPRGHSYAREIAARYGIGYDQLLGLLRERGLIEGD